MQNVRKILFFADAQLGDLLLLTPALKALKATIPDSTITLLLLHRRYYNDILPHTEITASKFNGTSEVFLNNPYVDNIFELDRQSLRTLKGLKRIKAELKCISFLKKMKFDAMVCTFPQSRFLLWAYLCGCPVRIGQKDQPMSYLLTHKVNTTAKEKGVLNYYCSLLEPLGVRSECGNLVYNISEDEKNSALQLLKDSGIDTSKKILFIHPGASGAYKIWPPEYFAETADYVLDNQLVQVVIGSSTFDKDVVAALSNASKHKLIVLNIQTIREMAAVVSCCSLSLVNNSGPRHISAAVGVKSLSLFQKFDNGEWSIYDNKIHPVIELNGECPICPNNKCESIIPAGKKFGSECMRLITPKQVIAKIKDIL